MKKRVTKKKEKKKEQKGIIFLFLFIHIYRYRFITSQTRRATAVKMLRPHRIY